MFSPRSRPKVEPLELQYHWLGIRQTTPPIEILEDPADVGSRAHRATLHGLIANAALALISIAGEAVRIEERERREIAAVADADPLAPHRAEVISIGKN